MQPTQITVPFPAGAGDCIFYAGLLYDFGLIGVKVSPYICAVEPGNRSAVTAYTLLLSAHTGEPLLLCDSQTLTAARTAATTALALKFLTDPRARTLAVIGTGPLAIGHAAYVGAQHPWSSIRMWSRSVADAESARAKQSIIDDHGVSAAVVESLEDAVGDADVVMLCTSSEAPVIKLESLNSSAVVTSISTSGPRAHEIDPAQLSILSVFCDYRATAPLTGGEMIIAQQSGWSPDSIIADLPELVSNGDGFVTPNGRKFFRSTGLGIEDIAIASLLL